MFKKLIKYTVVYPTVGVIGLAVILAVTGYESSTETQASASTVEYTSTERNIIRAHTQYESAVENGHRGYRSSYLPRDTKTRPYKGDEYRYCINMQWFKAVDGSADLDEHDFCAWHAEIGQWQYNG